jgi:hypothetical protein
MIRLHESQPNGTLGALLISSIPFCVTLEPPDLLNKKNVSCIPGPQTYLCRRKESPSYGDTFEVTDVPDRSHVLFHPGNRKRDTEGCIIVAEAWWKLTGTADEIKVKNSWKTFDRFMWMMEGIDEFWLNIAYSL